MNKSNRNKAVYRCELVVSFMFTLIVFVLFEFISSGSFYTNDEVLMRSIASGDFTGSNSAHLVYIMAPLGVMISLFYGVMPSLPWYDIYIFIIHYFSIWMILFGVGVLVKGKLLKLLSVTIVAVSFCGMYGSHFLYSQFTLIASIPFAAGVVLFFAYLSKQKNGFMVLSVALFLLSMALRKQVFFMGCPLLAGVYMLGIMEKRIREKVFRHLGILILSTLLFLGIDKLFYSSNPWKDYIRYNDYFALSEDYYGFPSYENAQTVYENYNISKIEREIISSLNISFIDDYTYEAAEAIANEGAKWKQIEISERGVDHYVWLVKNEFVNSFKTKTVGRLFYVMSGMLVFIALIKLDLIGIFVPACCLIYQLVFSSYFIVKNRFPERISLGLYLIELFIVASYCLYLLFSKGETRIHSLIVSKVAYSNNKGIKYLIRTVLGISCVFLLVISLVGLKDEVARIEENQAEWDLYIEEAAVLSDYCCNNSGSIYLVDGSVGNWLCDRMFKNGYKDRDNIVPLSYWTEKSPIFERKKELNGLSSLSDDLLKGDNVYVIQRDSVSMEWLEAYYSDQGMNVECKVVDSIWGAQGRNIVVSVCIVE